MGTMDPPYNTVLNLSSNLLVVGKTPADTVVKITAKVLILADSYDFPQFLSDPEEYGMEEVGSFCVYILDPGGMGGADSILDMAKDYADKHDDINPIYVAASLLDGDGQLKPEVDDALLHDFGGKIIFFDDFDIPDEFFQTGMFEWLTINRVMLLFGSHFDIAVLRAVNNQIEGWDEDYWRKRGFSPIGIRDLTLMVSTPNFGQPSQEAIGAGKTF